jgi:hypothetical protein
MHRLFCSALLGLVSFAGLGFSQGEDTPKAKKGETCGSFGTQVEFLDTPSAAARQATKEEKLVFVLHVSGNFEDPRFT